MRRLRASAQISPNYHISYRAGRQVVLQFTRSIAVAYGFKALAAKIVTLFLGYTFIGMRSLGNCFGRTYSALATQSPHRRIRSRSGGQGMCHHIGFSRHFRLCAPISPTIQNVFILPLLFLLLLPLALVVPEHLMLLLYPLAGCLSTLQ